MITKLNIYLKQKKYKCFRKTKLSQTHSKTVTLSASNLPEKRFSRECLYELFLKDVLKIIIKSNKHLQTDFIFSKENIVKIKEYVTSKQSASKDKSIFL